MHNNPQGILLDPDYSSTIHAKGKLILNPEKFIQPISAPGALLLAFMGAGVVIWMWREIKL